MQTDRQKEIVKVALELISQKGIQGFTIKNLSKKIGITEPAIYRHFKSKAQIIVTILELFRKNTNGIFKAELEYDSNSIMKIERLFLKHFELFSENLSLVSVIFPEDIFKNEPMLADKIFEIIDSNDRILMEIIRSGQEKGEIRPDINIAHISTMIIGTLRLSIKKWQYSDYSFNLLEEGKKLVNTIKLLIKNTNK